MKRKSETETPSTNQLAAEVGEKGLFHRRSCILYNFCSRLDLSGGSSRSRAKFRFVRRREKLISESARKGAELN